MCWAWWAQCDTSHWSQNDKQAYCSAGVISWSCCRKWTNRHPSVWMTRHTAWLRLQSSFFCCGRWLIWPCKETTTATYRSWLTINYYFCHVEKPTTLQTQYAYQFSWSIFVIFTMRLRQSRELQCLGLVLDPQCLISVSSRTKCPMFRSRLGLIPMRLWFHLISFLAWKVSCPSLLWYKKKTMK